MRILVVAHGASHVPWVVPLAWAARLAGHEVRVAARPQSLAGVRSAGLIAVPIGEHAAGEAFARGTIPDAAERPERVPADWPMGPLPWSEERRLAWAGQVLGLADSLADDLVGFARHWRPDLVVYDIGAVVGLVAAAAVGVPAIGHGWVQPMGLYFLAENEIPPAYFRMFERFGVAPSVGTDTWIDPCPPALARPSRVPKIPVRYVPYNGSGEIPDWLRREPERPRVCVSGGITTRNFNERREQLLDEVEGLDAEIVLAVAGHEEFDGLSLPANVRLTGWIPLGAVVQTCSALVHHGGAGSGMTGLAYGVPQLVVPDGRDSTQWLWGDLVERAGAGICVDPDRQAVPGGLRSAIGAVLGQPEFTAAAREVRAEIDAMPSPASVVAQLEDRAAVPAHS
ncbi:nucleotide disphospho-sugar-binding domain-containing protein [Amycolatopsis sp. NPDC059657]|uniref:nucleotide disphospho-sugar-binding domain-containing protein n=1 Tax=Amycolatopsis sp. NPDC059657 TaxID=3346899 RepID=UPI00366AD7D7